MIPWGLAFKIGGPVVLLVGLWLGIEHVVGNVRADERGKVTAEYRDVERQAEIADLRSALDEARRRAGITEKSNADMSKELADGRVQLASYVDRMRRTLAKGATGGASGSLAAGTAGGAGGTDQETLLDDLDICTENTARLINAKSWYEQQKKVER